MKSRRLSRKGFTPLENESVLIGSHDKKPIDCQSGKTRLRKKRSLTGFTLIELVMVIVVLGFLAVAALPSYFDISTAAQTANEDGVVGGVRAGIATQFVSVFTTGIGTPTFPASLDTVGVATTCDSANPCFSTVLPGGVTDGNWTKTTATQYTGPNSGTYTYNSSNGTFTSP
ncbi:MAG: hypothetical protein COV74_02710 [Candidatus Omnitrophica bacterium CG11_big_fil_rev_8_21_14_0_20_45_26]|uniref:Type II secretion system protein n=1 Tax=Candidatus Abzuiibacterium crystallinum TaxID=1974748 RepID=A0A2H0LR81_9BACT|nr:MAG: hypothetical protein COV74_02710 [Candidatus Omnitrophica bacterium CG11_big_fil_rev_8_21_14_0_20_45_26]PIW65567.1 MAG: hypothetical protein COW12_01210 [Candidatus Omnitrophica bacterium CG12_big_fil_rev_8_21_14_0_65_45_16]